MTEYEEELENKVKQLEERNDHDLATCQKEIRRLRSVVRELNAENEALKAQINKK
jgi:predicted RNase H-like nuclease (RuvC/YqgF family)